MQTLLHTLVNGTTEYQEDGTVIHRPPNAAMLRAARELQGMSNTLAINQQTLMSLQFRVEGQLNEITILQEQLNEYRGTIDKLNADIQDLRIDIRLNGNEEVDSDVGRSSGEPSPSDSDGEGRGTN